jgi:hypothetical protein
VSDRLLDRSDAEWFEFTDALRMSMRRPTRLRIDRSRATSS